jgi:hypothetical protein
MQSGRTPCPSRIASTASPASTTSANAPRTWRAASISASAGLVGRQRHQVQEDLGVERGLEDRARRLEPARTAAAFDEVAVVREREVATAIDDVKRLRVLERDAARGRVAVVADRDEPGSFAQRGVVEHVGHEPEPAVRVEPP